MSQQYSKHQPYREGRNAENVPADLEEGQRRSGGGDAHGPSPYFRRQEEALTALNLGGTTKRIRSRPKSAGRERFISTPSNIPFLSPP